MAEEEHKEEIEDEEALFDPSLKKKKKKKKAAEEDADEAAPAEDAEKKDDEDDGDEEDDEDIDFGKKKKSKKTAQKKEGDGESWQNSDRDYTYEELLSRVSTLMLNNNPDLIASRRNKVMKPPQVFREGTKKTVWANFKEICQVFNRNIDHVLAYSLAEMGTNGSLDGNSRLVIKGRFNPKQIEAVVRHYVAEYVACRNCRSLDTNLKKENRLYFIHCKACQSSRSVAAIKTGYVAQVGKRKK
eukprot:CAMPEP_0177655822 /NCGR_PEP_ID=MMETSP0447-20121125/15194_1 /TAXON_ID=0 /ORGANISM="Stygamoeba regulata, Strain BSH-02190019" /LENGTH=242 /DNA_ID=CAMNT_0019159811 /DNA_START=27 /DNA_END=755 /DNA_ORIENTATION=-